jgi:hypothetical protein
VGRVLVQNVAILIRWWRWGNTARACRSALIFRAVCAKVFAQKVSVPMGQPRILSPSLYSLMRVVSAI